MDERTKIILVDTVLIVFIGFAIYFFVVSFPGIMNYFNGEKVIDSYQGPVPYSSDEEYFRETGQTVGGMCVDG